MKTTEFGKGWRRWITLSRGVPLVTILVAATVGILAMLGYLQATAVEGTLLAVLALLAVDALTERISLLEKIEDKLSNVSSTYLKSRAELPTWKERGQTASEIFVVGVSLVSAVVPHLDFFEQKMKDGCRLRFLLLDPSSSAVQTWNMMNKVPNAKADIELCLKSLEHLKRLEKTVKGKCEVRLAPVIPPFSAAIFDPSKDTGYINVEHPAYRKALGERPHFQLTRAGENRWFEFYKTQFEQLWTPSQKWEPPTTEGSI